MKKIINTKKLYSLGVLGVILMLPMHIVYAGLVKCGNTGQASCTICDLVAGIHGVVQFIVGLVAITGVVVITIAGVAYILSAGSPGMTSWAKSAVKNTLIGVAVILLAFMAITFIINRIFNNVESDLPTYEGGLTNYGNLWEFECSVNSSGTPSQSSTSSTTGSASGTGSGTSPGSGATGAVSADEQNARDMLRAASNGKVSVWESRPGATKIQGLRKESVDGVLAFQREADVPVIVTGAAESGYHDSGNYSHEKGYKVDIEDTSAVNDYIASHYTSVPVSDTGRSDITAAYSDGRGNMYYRESTHWDVCYQCGT